MIVVAPSPPCTTPSQQIRIEAAGARTVHDNPIRRNCQQSFDAIHRKSYRRTAVDHDDTGIVIERCLGEAEQASKAYDRQNRAAQVGEAEQASGRERHVGKGGIRMISLTLSSRNRERLLADARDHERAPPSLAAGMRRHAAVAGGAASLAGRACWLRLAMTAPDVFGQ